MGVTDLKGNAQDAGAMGQEVKIRKGTQLTFASWDFDMQVFYEFITTCHNDPEGQNNESA